MKRSIAIVLLMSIIVSLISGCGALQPITTDPSIGLSGGDPTDGKDPTVDTSTTDGTTDATDATDATGATGATGATDATDSQPPTETEPGQNTTQPQPPVTEPDPTDPPATEPPGQDAGDTALFNMLFDINNKISLRLDMSKEELAKMQADYEKFDAQGSKSPIYRIGNLTVIIKTPSGSVRSYYIPEVGVRMKGNTSRTAFYNEKDGIYNVIHLKLSFQETFDNVDFYGSAAKTWNQAERIARKNRTFATLEKLDLRWNRCDDSTYLKEYFAYATYRENGVLAPHTNLTSFDWAGLHMGVFTINEPVDDVFLKKNLPPEALGGDLYKLGWAGSNNASFTRISSIGIEDEVAKKFYAYDLKTNKKTSTHAALTNLIKSLNSGTVTKERFAELVDIDTFLPYCAVSYLLGNPDDLRNNYNNSYIYFRADNGKAVIIPYDFDRCLGITTHWNPTGNAVTADDPFGKTLLATGEEQRSPLFLYSVTPGGHYVREYAAILQQIVNGDWFTHETFSDLYSIVFEHYSKDATPGKKFHNTNGLKSSFSLERTSSFSSNDNISMLDYLNAKLKTLNKYMQRLDEYASAQSPAANTGWYVRADYTDWAVNEQHTLTAEGNLLVYTVSRNREFRLKVYSKVLDNWYGSECVSKDSPVSCRTDDHTNIILDAGSYKITFDPVTETITIEEQ